MEKQGGRPASVKLCFVLSQCILKDQKDQICLCTVYGKISLYFSIILQP